MMLFWISTLILVAIAAAFVAIPLLRGRTDNDSALRDALNKAFYKDRLAELEEETEEGLVADQQDLIADLKQSLLDDIPEPAAAQASNPLPVWAVLVPSLAFVAALSYGLYAWHGEADQVARWQRVSGELPALTEKLMSTNGQALSDEEMQDLSLSLRTRLYYEPDDAEGWLLLGRIAMANRDLDTALGAMGRAYELAPSDTGIQIGYAQALLSSSEEWEQSRARTLLTRLAQRGIEDLRVYSLLAFDAFNQGDYATAVRYWRQMQQLLGPDDARYEMLSRSIDNAERKLTQTGEAAAHPVSVTIRLGEQVTLPAQGVLIVSLHSADGAPMPVAAARYPLGSFPLTVTLDDRASMMEGRKVSDLTSLIARARIDTDGNVTTHDSDWYGESAVVKAGEPVEVVINQHY